MMKYELIPHTADIRLQVAGTTKEELFIAALQGMASVIKKDSCVNKFSVIKKMSKQRCIGIYEIKKELKIKSLDLTSLIIDFLSEVLTASYIQKTVFEEIKFLKLNEHELHAIIMGMKVDAFDHDIKAVTYHEANVHKNASGDLQTIIVFDL